MFQQIKDEIKRNGYESVNRIIENFTLVQSGIPRQWKCGAFLLSKFAPKLNQFMNNIKILWVDDEIDLLKSQIIFLREKGYDVVEATNGTDAVDRVRDEDVDVVFLDENMPGISGL